MLRPRSPTPPSSPGDCYMQNTATHCQKQNQGLLPREIERTKTHTESLQHTTEVRHRKPCGRWLGAKVTSSQASNAWEQA